MKTKIRYCGVIAMILQGVSGISHAADQDLRATGKQVFDRWCVHCHGDGPEYPGTVALQALYKGAKPALLERRTDLAPAITGQFVRNGVSIMPFFRKTEISDAELAALAAYLAPR
ncbi:MAG: cytochrome c [Gammaproteobacteria bacterium]|nr:cytochrome c [Gammaproteobacteria bacterium]